MLAGLVGDLADTQRITKLARGQRLRGRGGSLAGVGQPPDLAELILDLKGRASRAMARWGPQVHPNPESSIRLGHKEGAPVSEDSAPSSPTAGRLMVSCEISGCGRRIAYSGAGRRPKYCGQTVDGLPHTRLTAYRLSHGEVQLPAGAGDANTREGESGGRPVSLARLTLEGLLEEVRAVTGAHETRMAGLAERIASAVTVASDPDAAMAEVTGAHREARGAIDAAEAERDTAQSAARESERAADAAEQRRQSAEDAAELALTEVDTAQEQRDQAHTSAQEATQAGDRVRAELVAATTELRRSTERGDALAAELADARDQLTAELATEREHTDTQRRRADDAERETARAHGSVEQLGGELGAARETREHQQVEVGRMGAELATATAQLAAARELLETTKTHAAERVADLRRQLDPPTGRGD